MLKPQPMSPKQPLAPFHLVHGALWGALWTVALCVRVKCVPNPVHGGSAGSPGTQSQLGRGGTGPQEPNHSWVEAKSPVASTWPSCAGLGSGDPAMPPPWAGLGSSQVEAVQALILGHGGEA